MAEALVHLVQNINSTKTGLTHEEANILQSGKSKAVRCFMESFLIGGTVVWAATWRLSRIKRVTLSAGAATFYGMWRFGRSIDSFLEDILTQNGSRLQKELATILSQKYQNDPSKMQLISKHFYLENVFDDSNLDYKLRWRYRNFYSDNGIHDQSILENNSQNKADNAAHTYSSSDAPSGFQNEAPNDSGMNNNVETKQILKNLGSDIMGDPLDCVFGHAAPVEQNLHSNVSNAPSRVHIRGHKKLHRRRQMHHRRDLLNSQ